MLVLAYAVFAAIQIQVLNPLAAAPGLSLREIHAAVGATNDSMLIGLMLALLLPGPMIAAGLLWSSSRGWVPWIATIAAQLGLLTLGTLVYVAASFGPGMTLADTFGIGGADHSPWATPLFALSGVSLLILLVLGITALRGPRGVPAPATP